MTLTKRRKRRPCPPVTFRPMPPPFTRDEYDALPEVLTAREVAAILDTSEIQVRRWAASGQLPSVQLGNRWRFSKRAIEEYIGRGRPPS